MTFILLERLKANDWSTEQKRINCPLIFLLASPPCSSRWLEYVKTNPTYWYTLGYAITKAWVLGFISGALSTFGAVAIERLASAD